jgi:hypothetical protein
MQKGLFWKEILGKWMVCDTEKCAIIRLLRFWLKNEGKNWQKFAGNEQFCALLSKN